MPVHVLRWRCEKDQETALLRTVKFFSKKEKMRKKGCPGPENRRKFRLHRFSSDGKLEATVIFVSIVRKTRMNREYFHL